MTLHRTSRISLDDLLRQRQGAENKDVLSKKMHKPVGCSDADRKSCCPLLKEKRKELELRSGF
jgi:hypothetical protein